jgi:primary-amine oxidase
MLASTSHPRVHPLIGLSAAEITRAGSTLSKCLQQQADNLQKSIRFKHITLEEPPKALLLPYLDAESTGVAVAERPFVPRCAQLSYTEPNGTHLQEAVVSLDTETLVSNIEANKGQHAPLERWTYPSLPPYKTTNVGIAETKLSWSI